MKSEPRLVGTGDEAGEKTARMKYEPYIGVDLDGTLAKQYWPHDGEFHPLRIGEPIMPMVNRVRKMLEDGMTVKIFTARVGPIGNSPHNKGLKKADVQRAIFEWTEKYVGVGLEATSVKDYCMVELWDDRSIRIIHNTGAPYCEDNRKAAIALSAPLS